MSPDTENAEGTKASKIIETIWNFRAMHTLDLLL